MAGSEPFDEESPSEPYREGRLTFQGIWTIAPAMKACLRQASLAAGFDKRSVLILGETGTGKNLLAQAIHNGSRRADGPFVALNIASLSDTLIASELFGSVEGVFTGATDRAGYLEQANGGTLFIDEISGLRLELQQKILTALEKKGVHRVGDSSDRQPDFRLICATNCDLHAAMGRGEFRKDLYYRISDLEISVPPLRERVGDIEMLAKRFLPQPKEDIDTEVRDISAECLGRMREYSWPGNIRELRAAVLRAMLRCTGPTLEASHMAPELVTDGSGGADCDQVPGMVTLAEVERWHIGRVLAATGWNKAKAMEILGITRPTLDKKVAKYGLERPSEDA